MKTFDKTVLFEIKKGEKTNKKKKLKTNYKKQNIK